MIVRVSAPCRLHFGLLHVPVPGLTHWPDGTPLRPFGGLGLMIDGPFIDVMIEPAAEWSVTGCLSTRARQFIDKLQSPQPLSVTANGPPEHIGLGVGTALGLAVAHAIAIINGESKPAVQKLAKQTGRGERSRIGLAGFQSGGFIVDLGHADNDILPQCLPFPEDWRVVVMTPPIPTRWHGDRERRAFQSNRTADEALETTTRLTRLIDDSILPALQARQFHKFAPALHNYNRIAGEHFADVQGGIYSDPTIAELIEFLCIEGYDGVGQSSWGPSVFVLCESQRDAERLFEWLKRKHPTIEILGLSNAAESGVSVEITES
ncbi:beta-ribofuranosylaminobenzene 5-phosphate synthase [soil metagenome]